MSWNASLFYKNFRKKFVDLLFCRSKIISEVRHSAGSVISEIYDQNYFDTEQKAINWANAKGLEFLSNQDLAFDHKNCNHYTLHEIIVN